MTQSFAEKPGLVRWALMRGTRQRRRQHQQTVSRVSAGNPAKRAKSELRTAPRFAPNDVGNTL